MEKLLENYDRIILFDTETTGLDATKNQIIEIAAIGISASDEVKEMDEFVKLHSCDTIPAEIVEKTGITDEMVAAGIEETEAVNRFMALFGEKTLLIAYNAQFDLDFLAHAIIRSAKDQLKLFNTADYLDPLCVAKDRKPYPHKLCDMIDFYKITDVVNSHRAIDDVKALAAVVEAMETERNDVFKYVNLFGFNPKYGAPERRFKKVCYHPQPYGKPKLPYDILPYKAGLWVYETA